MSVTLQIWAKDGGKVHASDHPTAESALRRWREVSSKGISVLSTPDESTRRPTPWEAAASPKRLLASPGFVQMFSHRIVTRPLPEDLETDYATVVLRGFHAEFSAPPPEPVPDDRPPARLFPERGYPAWFQAYRLDGIELRPEIRAALAPLNATLLSDLADKTEDAYPGKGSELRAALDRALRRERRLRKRTRHVALRTRERAARMAGAEDRPLLPVLAESVQGLNPHQREALARTVGLDGSPETMAAIGRSLGITRERVRQVVGRALDLCDASHGWPSAISRRIDAVCLIRPAREAFSDEAWARGMTPETIEKLYTMLKGWKAARDLQAAVRRA